MASPYVHERQSEYWTSRQIEEFFLDAGYEILVFPLTQYNEKLVPTDFIFFDKQHSKLFGFQYKAIYHEGKQEYWPLDKMQHENLGSYPWIYYSLSELRRASEFRAALHQVRILETAFPYQEKLYPKGKEKIVYYSRWAAFYEGLVQCPKGVLVHSVQELTKFLKPKENVELPWELTKSLVDVFVADIASKNVVHLSPFLRE
jgi:hypothetical protein